MKRHAFLSLLFLASYAQAQAPSDERARWEERQASEHRFRVSMFTRAGFAPIEEVQAGGRQVRRLLLIDPYMILPVPGIELERHADQRVTLRLQYYGWSSDPVPVDRGSWDALQSNPAWRDAREAIARFKEVNDYREARLQRLRQLAAAAPNASPADRAKMRQAIEAWSHFQQAQQRNYADLLERLARVGD